MAGCASVNRMHATSDAIDKGLIEGLSATNKYKAAVWGFPGKPLGPYTKLGGLTLWLTDDPHAPVFYAVYLGKSRETRRWEVFASMVGRDGKWQPVPVKAAAAIPEGARAPTTP